MVYHDVNQGEITTTYKSFKVFSVAFFPLQRMICSSLYNIGTQGTISCVKRISLKKKRHNKDGNFLSQIRKHKIHTLSFTAILLESLIPTCAQQSFTTCSTSKASLTFSTTLAYTPFLAAQMSNPY